MFDVLSSTPYPSISASELVGRLGPVMQFILMSRASALADERAPEGYRDVFNPERSEESREYRRLMLEFGNITSEDVQKAFKEMLHLLDFDYGSECWLANLYPQAEFIKDLIVRDDEEGD